MNPNAQPVEVCEWREDDSAFFQSPCTYRTYTWTPTELSWKFCPHCGKPIREVPFEEVSGDE